MRTSTTSSFVILLVVAAIICAPGAGRRRPPVAAAAVDAEPGVTSPGDLLPDAAAYTAYVPGVAYDGPLPPPPPPPPPARPEWTPSLLVTPLYQGDTSRNVIYFTIDDGWGYLGDMLAILRDKGVKATACLTGVDLLRVPSDVAAWHAAGYSFCNHSYSHSVLAAGVTPDEAPDPLVPDGIVASATSYDTTGELLQAEAALASIVPGATMHPFFRPPYGAHNEVVRSAAAALGYRAILWNIDPEDWKATATASGVTANVLANARPGAIVLFHAGSVATLQALPGIIDSLHAAGYSIEGLETLPSDR